MRHVRAEGMCVCVGGEFGKIKVPEGSSAT